MPINWQAIIATIGTTVGGGVVVLSAAAWLIRALVSNRLTLDVEKFKIEMKSEADAEIERVKAALIKAARVHERQLEILSKLYRHLYDVQGYLQRMTASGRMGGVTAEGEQVNEISPEKYAPMVGKALDSAHEELLNGRLFVPPALVQQCELFFGAVFEGQQNFTFAHLPMIDGAKQSEFWTAAATVAHQQVPKILQQIEGSARGLVHGEPADNQT